MILWIRFLLVSIQDIINVIDDSWNPIWIAWYLQPNKGSGFSNLIREPFEHKADLPLYIFLDMISFHNQFPN